MPTRSRVLTCPECGRRYDDDAPGLSRHLYADHGYDAPDATQAASDALTGARADNWFQP